VGSGIVLAGTLELRDRIMAKRNKALRSRVFAPCLLSVMMPDEIPGTIEVRCKKAGGAVGQVARAGFLNHQQATLLTHNATRRSIARRGPGLKRIPPLPSPGSFRWKLVPLPGLLSRSMPPRRSPSG
jgi:hypothetical protein